nr:MAG: hypothetical protein 3 [Leviviridae sp.]
MYTMDFNPGMLQNLLSLSLNTGRGVLDATNHVGAAKAALLESVFKKWKPKDPRPLEDVAIDGFLAANAHCRDFTLSLDPVSEVILRMAKSHLHDVFLSGAYQTSVLTLSSCLQAGRAGPGASVGTRHTTFFKKMFDGRLSVTDPILYMVYKDGISTRWYEAELTRASLFQVDVVEGSNLSTVPKNCRTNRTICTEPSLNMFFQLGAGHIIEGLLERYHNINIRAKSFRGYKDSPQPEINRSMARQGSIDQVFSTIDLKSASDTISCKLLEYLLPSNVYSVLNAIRSKRTRVRGEFVDLHLFSSMGNGFTFPLQTLIFASIVRACYQYVGITPLTREHRNYSVFGDDIICLTEVYDLVTYILSVAGFWVNSEKSYSEGPFRESCGGDYFMGHDIRGVYIKEIRHEADLYSVFNRLARWSCKHNIDITPALQYVKGLVDFRPVPLHAGDTEGIKCPRDLLTNRKTDRNGAIYYRPLVPKSVRLNVEYRSSFVNPDAGIICHIGGYLEEHKATVRPRQVLYKVARRKTPSWDYTTDAGLDSRDLFSLFLSLEN